MNYPVYKLRDWIKKDKLVEFEFSLNPYAIYYYKKNQLSINYLHFINTPIDE